MNLPKKHLVNIIGTLIILAALAAGALLGRLTSPTVPAHAGTPDSPTCHVICGHGSGGITPRRARPSTPNGGGGGIIGGPPAR